MAKKGFSCPHCKQPARIRSSRDVTDLTRDLYVECTNITCGWTGTAAAEITKELSPPRVRNPVITLPSATTDDIQNCINSQVKETDQLSLI